MTLDRGAASIQNSGMAAEIRPGTSRLHTLEREECLRLLQSVRYGTLATVDGGQPLLVVLNHLVDRDGIYFRTRTDARLARLTEGGLVPPAVFEVDSATRGRGGLVGDAHRPAAP